MTHGAVQKERAKHAPKKQNPPFEPVQREKSSQNDAKKEGGRQHPPNMSERQTGKEYLQQIQQ